MKAMEECIGAISEDVPVAEPYKYTFSVLNWLLAHHRVMWGLLLERLREGELNCEKHKPAETYMRGNIHVVQCVIYVKFCYLHHTPILAQL